MLSLCEGWGLVVGSTAGLQLTVPLSQGFWLVFCFRGFDLVKVILFVLFKVILKCMALSVLAGLVCLPEGPVVILYTFYV